MPLQDLFNWGVSFFGYRKVLDFLEAQVTLYDNSTPGQSRPTRAIPRTIHEIAEGAGLPEGRVGICLRRLLRKRLAEHDGSERWHVLLYL